MVGVCGGGAAGRYLKHVLIQGGVYLPCGSYNSDKTTCYHPHLRSPLGDPNTISEKPVGTRRSIREHRKTGMMSSGHRYCPKSNTVSGRLKPMRTHCRTHQIASLGIRGQKRDRLGLLFDSDSYVFDLFPLPLVLSFWAASCCHRRAFLCVLERI